MKYLINILFMSVLFAHCIGQENTSTWKTPLNPSYVPLEVQLSFIKKHSNIKEIKWYPYPYENTNLVNINGSYQPKTIDHIPKYFEGHYYDKKSAIKEVYNNLGERKIIITNKAIEETPKNMLDSFNLEQFNGWKILGYETAQFSEYMDQIMHKLYLSEGNHLHVFYFNQDLVEQKHIDWEFYSTSDTTEITNEHNLNEKMSWEDLSWKIKYESPEPVANKLSSESKELESLYLHDEIVAINYFEIGNLNFKNEIKEYSHSEISKDEIIKANIPVKKSVLLLNELPDSLKNRLSGQYGSWSFDERVEQIELQNGTYDFRFHGLDNNTHHVITIHTF